ncbi:hypothetical protein VTK56DRAFT_782 [Thermocarpiscus australiensis]
MPERPSFTTCGRGDFTRSRFESPVPHKHLNKNFPSAERQRGCNCTSDCYKLKRHCRSKSDRQRADSNRCGRSHTLSRRTH